MERLGGWFWYISKDEKILEREKCGKWMYFFTNQELAQQVCQKAIDEEVCYECKCTDIAITETPQGVVCFYVNGDDLENHKRVIQFMMDNNLIRKTKTGKLYNISFKYDTQTRAGEYGTDFMGN